MDSIIFNTFDILAKRAAFYAGVWRNGKFTVSVEDAIEYRDNFPYVYKVECARIDAGGIPRKITMEVIKTQLKKKEIN